MILFENEYQLALIDQAAQRPPRARAWHRDMAQGQGMAHNISQPRGEGRVICGRFPPFNPT